MIMDLKKGQGEIVYLPYDMGETIKRMEEAEVPSFVIDRFRRSEDITQKDRTRLC